MTCQDVFIREVLVSYHQTSQELFNIRDAADVATFVRKTITDNSREHFLALYLNGAHAVASYSTISIGTATTAPVHAREVFQRAIVCGSSAIVVAHTHPSGQTDPSPEDMRVTRMLKEAGELLGIQLLDHVIVTDTAHRSLREHSSW